MSPDLVTALRNSRNLLNDEQAGQFQQKLQQEAIERQVLALRSELRARRAAAAPSAPAAPALVQNRFATALAGDLVVERDGMVQPFDASTFRAAPYLAFYFSAQWCAPCRKFSPQLVRFYQELKAQHPEFELIFVSSDRSAFGMQNYLETDHMPWPAVAFDKIPRHPEITRYRGEGIPCLVLVDAQGAVVSDSFVQGQYVGPEKILQDLARIFPAHH